MGSQWSGTGTSGAVDEELEELLGIEPESPEDTGNASGQASDGVAPAADLPDMQVKSFRRPDRLETEQPHRHFSDKSFYKQVLSGEGEAAKKLHQALSGFLRAEDSQERADYRSRVITAHWQLLEQLAAQIGTLPVQKQLFLRFSLLLPTAVSAEQREMLARVIPQNRLEEPVHYVDEWLEEVAYGRVNQSATDETKPSKRSQAQKVSERLERARGRRDAQLGLLRKKVNEITAIESRLQDAVASVCRHAERPDYPELVYPYEDRQKALFGEISQMLKKLSGMNRDLERGHRELDSMEEELHKLKEQEVEAGELGSSIDADQVVGELRTVRQMAKMCVGRQGNHFPILMKQYLGNDLTQIGTRENVVNIAADVEYLDPQLFQRTFKQQKNRIVPHMVLVPCYGDSGICWEPFERYNRATSRGRLAIPMYPKDVRIAVITALGDLRWQVAKEKAQHYWMEEGLTGWYYGWFSEQKLKGDVKDQFIQHYVLWITKESEGNQKLPREVRSIFWRYMPFPQEVKDKLKNRGFVYQDLYKKDQNRELSDGY